MKQTNRLFSLLLTGILLLIITMTSCTPPVNNVDPPAADLTKSTITVTAGPPYAGFTVANSDQIVFGFDYDPASGDADIPMYLPPGVSAFTVVKNGLPCAIGNSAGAYGTLIEVPTSDSGSITLSGGLSGTYIINVKGSVSPGTGDWEVGPVTIVNIQFIRAIPKININYPSAVLSGAAGVVLDAGSTVPVFEPDALSPAPEITSYSWTQTQGPAVVLLNSDTSTAAFNAPAVAADTDLCFQLTVTDDAGLTSAETVTIPVLANP